MATPSAYILARMMLREIILQRRLVVTMGSLLLALVSDMCALRASMFIILPTQLVQSTPVRRRPRHLVPIIPPVAFIAIVCERECKSSVALLRVHPHIAHFLSKVPSKRKPGSFVAFSGLAFHYVCFLSVAITNKSRSRSE